MKAKIQSIIINLNNIKETPAFEFRHFIRGELFVYIDMILTTNFHLKKEGGADIPKQEVEDILEICKFYCKLYHSWLAALPNTFEAVYL